MSMMHKKVGLQEKVLCEMLFSVDECDRVSNFMNKCRKLHFDDFVVVFIFFSWLILYC